MPADMAEDSPDLLKTLEENRRTLQKQIGCLAGLLQIFDRHHCLTRRRFGSNRTSTTNGDAASRACGTDTLHEPGSPLMCHEFEAQHPGSKVSFHDENRGSAILEERVSINEEGAAPSRLFSDYVSRISENERPQRETPGRTTIEHKSPGTSVTLAAQRRMSVDGRLSCENFPRSPEPSLIRNIVVNSLHKEKPGVDNSNREVMAGLIRLKNLARSRSVGGRNGYFKTSVEFPRSNSLSAQRSSGIYKGGNEDGPELLAREEIASNLTRLRRSVDGSEPLRLFVELEEGPGVGTKKLRRINSHNYYERDAARQVIMNLDKSLGALDLKESFRALQRDKSIRRSLVDRDQTSPAEVCVTPGSCVDGRRSPLRELTSSQDEREGRHCGSNVVARLMGLEEYSSPPTLRKDCTDAGSIKANGHGHQRRGRSLSPKHRLMDGMPSPLQQQEVREALKSRLTKSMKHFYEEGPLLTLQGCKTPPPTLEPLHGDIMQRLQQLRSRNFVEERETLNQILETLQLKGLLHSPQPKSSATPEYVRHRFATTKDTSEQSRRESMTCQKMKHEEAIVAMKPIQKDADCKSIRPECSERSQVITDTRFSTEDRGSTKPVRGKSRSPVRSKVPLILNDDTQSTSQVRAGPIAIASIKLRSNLSTSSSSNARSPHAKQVLQGLHANSHLRDKKESKAALVTVRGTQCHGSSLKNDTVSDAKPDGTTKNCATQTVKSSAEVILQNRPLSTTSRDAPSLVPRPLSPVRDFEDICTPLESIAENKKPPSEGNSVAATQATTDHDSCVDRQTLDTTPARIREILQTLKDQQMSLNAIKDFSDAKESSEAMTPRAGFQVGKIDPALEKSRQGSGGCEQQSPVSVLDNSVFEEDDSPSPMAAVNLQDSDESNERDHQCHKVRLETLGKLATTSLTSADPDDNATCVLGRDKERNFVDELLMLSGIAKHTNWASGTFPSRAKHSGINPGFLVVKEDLQRAPDAFFRKCHKLERGTKQMNTLDRQALIDFVCELFSNLECQYDNAQPWLESTWIAAGQEFKRENLVNAIWKELQEFPCAASDDICDTVQGILQVDLGSRGPRWTGFRAEIVEVGVEVEKLIYRDLMEEVVKDLQCSSSSTYLEKLLDGSSGPRRQLFAL